MMDGAEEQRHSSALSRRPPYRASMRKPRPVTFRSRAKQRAAPLAGEADIARWKQRSTYRRG